MNNCNSMQKQRLGVCAKISSLGLVRRTLCPFSLCTVQLPLFARLLALILQWRVLAARDAWRAALWADKSLWGVAMWEGPIGELAGCEWVDGERERGEGGDGETRGGGSGGREGVDLIGNMLTELNTLLYFNLILVRVRVSMKDAWLGRLPWQLPPGLTKFKFKIIKIRWEIKEGVRNVFAESVCSWVKTPSLYSTLYFHENPSDFPNSVRRWQGISGAPDIQSWKMFKASALGSRTLFLTRTRTTAAAAARDTVMRIPTAAPKNVASFQSSTWWWLMKWQASNHLLCWIVISISTVVSLY